MCFGCPVIYFVPPPDPLCASLDIYKYNREERKSARRWGGWERNGSVARSCVRSYFAFPFSAAYTLFLTLLLSYSSQQQLEEPSRTEICVRVVAVGSNRCKRSQMFYHFRKCTGKRGKQGNVGCWCWCDCERKIEKFAYPSVNGSQYV